jgi:hypothetical protein
MYTADSVGIRQQFAGGMYPTRHNTGNRPSHTELSEAVGHDSSKAVLVSVEMYECHTLADTIPYTLACDFKRDCQDGSDETHCAHPQLSDANKVFR